MTLRDWDSKEYRSWRAKIRRRDRYTCQMPNCGSKKTIKVHHILPWSRFQSNRYDEKNGICLCRKCHDSIAKKEHLYVKLFLSIVRRKYE
jgi:5-methylcytosine-specific restriction endonuclease McrA